MAHRLSLPNHVPLSIPPCLCAIHNPGIHELAYRIPSQSNSSSCNHRNMVLCADINFLLITESNTASLQSSPQCLSLASTIPFITNVTIPIQNQRGLKTSPPPVPFKAVSGTGSSSGSGKRR
ncbi:hypothetical protein J6590_081884 [Homalodisca vitripennis]|nr:hypothetical protein J6590_081884 [Homalodisca vitripennis]